MKSSARFALRFSPMALGLALVLGGSAAALAQTAAPAAGAAGTSTGSAAPVGPAGTDVPKLDTQLSGMLGRAGGLTSDQAAVRARATSYDVASKKADYDSAQASIDQANAAYVPRVKGTASYQRTSPVSLSLAPFNLPGSLAYPQNNWNLQVDADIPLSDYVLKIAKQHAAAEHSANAAKFTERAAKLTASSNARIQYYSWARAKLQQVVAADALEQARAHVNDAKAEFDAGKASQADLMAVQAQVAQNELLVVRATNAANLEEDRLRTAMHDSAGAHYEIGEPLLADLLAVPGEGDFNALLNEALSERAELKSLGEAARGLRAQAAASRFDILPKLDATGTAKYADPNLTYFPPRPLWQGTWGVGGAITWSDTDVLLGATNGSANEAKARSTEAQAMSMRDGIRDEVLAAWQSVKEAEVAIDSTQRSLASAEESYRVRRALFRADRATSTELTDSENALTGARFDAVNAKLDLRIARVRLTHATGRDDTGTRQNDDSD